MKTGIFILSFLLLTFANAPARAAESSADLLRKGLFEEEANQNLDAAIKAYQAIIDQLDEQRKIASTAVFRLAESYRKLGKTNEAAAQYERVLRDYSEQTNLVALSQSHLTAIRPLEVSKDGSARVLSVATDSSPTVAAQLLAQLTAIENLKNNPEDQGRAVYAVFPDEDLKRMLLNMPVLRKQEATLRAHPDDKLTSWQLAVAPSGLSSNLKGPPDLAQAQNESQQQLSFITQRVDFILGVQKAHLRVLQSMNGPAALAASPGSNPKESDLTDKEEKEIQRIGAMVKDSPDLVNALGDGSRTPLIKAASDGHARVVRFLIEHGAEVDRPISGGWTALHYAAQNGHKAVIEVLLEKGANVNVTEAGGNTPLHLAAEKGFGAVAETLLARGADPNLVSQHPASGLANDNFTVDKNNYRTRGTPLHYAAWRGYKSLVELLLDKGAVPDATDPDGVTPLQSATAAQRIPIAELLLKQKVDVNHVTRYGHTALHIAAAWGNSKLAELLLDKGADANIAGPKSPLLLAVVRGATETVRALLQHRADSNTRDGAGFLAVRHAVDSGSVEIVSLLLEAGADPNLAGPDGRTALSTAVSSPKMVQVLLAHGARVNVLDKDNNTPLDYATPRSPPPQLNWERDRALEESAKLLRAAGADEDFKYSSAISVGRRESNLRIVHFRRGTITQNRFTLLELLADHYLPLVPRSLEIQNQSATALLFPDFGRISIRKAVAQGTNAPEAISIEATFMGDCTKDRWLEWGDLVEIPMRDHPVNGRWHGLAETARQAWRKCLERRVEIVIKEQTNRITLVPRGTLFSISDRSFGNGRQDVKRTTDGGITTIANFWAGPVLQNSGLVRTSSDLTRVRVKRTDPTTKAVQEIVLNLENVAGSEVPNVASSEGPDPASGNDLWLRDGDVIDIPDKE